MSTNTREKREAANQELDLRFRDEVAALPGGEHLKKCFQCGVCTASCPVREIDAKYNPRKIIRMTSLGMRERVLSSDFIWLCSTCYLCTERCPQDVKVTDVMNVLKNMAVRQGYIHPGFATQARLIAENGRLYKIEDFDNEMRQEVGLPSLPAQCEEVAQIFKATGLFQKAGLLEKTGEER